MSDGRRDAQTLSFSTSAYGGTSRSWRKSSSTKPISRGRLLPEPFSVGTLYPCRHQRCSSGAHKHEAGIRHQPQSHFETPCGFSADDLHSAPPRPCRATPGTIPDHREFVSHPHDQSELKKAQGRGRTRMDLSKFWPQAMLLCSENVQTRPHAGIVRWGSGGTGRRCNRWCQ